MKKLFILLAVLVSTFAHAIDQPRYLHTATITIIDLIANTPNLSTLTRALQAGDMIYMLNNEGPFTIFAPTDAALRTMPIGMLHDLLEPENKQAMRIFLSYYIVRGLITPEQIHSSALRTLNGHPLTISVAGDQINVNYVKVLSYTQGSNGMIYVIDGSLVPPADWYQLLHHQYVK